MGKGRNKKIIIAFYIYIAIDKEYYIANYNYSVSQIHMKFSTGDMFRN